MPSWAHVALAPGAAICPSCARPLALPHDLLAFQWGYCPSRQPWDDLFYAVGDELLWRLDDDARARPWTYFEGAQQGGNIGDPAVADLLVRGFGLDGLELICGGCASGLALRIEGGRIVALVSAALASDVTLLDVATGALSPRPDWDDAPMVIVSVANRALSTASGRVIANKRAPR